jgi:hypothetical protein
MLYSDCNAGWSIHSCLGIWWNKFLLQTLNSISNLSPWLHWNLLQTSIWTDCFLFLLLDLVFTLLYSALCPRLVIYVDGINNFLALWILVGFDHWKTLTPHGSLLCFLLCFQREQSDFRLLLSQMTCWWWDQKCFLQRKRYHPLGMLLPFLIRLWLSPSPSFLFPFYFFAFYFRSRDVLCI